MYLDTVSSLRLRDFQTRDVSSKVRLTKAPDRYLETRASRRELPYEAMLASGRTTWSVGERVRVYRVRTGYPALVSSDDDAGGEDDDPRDYDVDHYLRLLRDTYAARLARALTRDDFAAVFADPMQPSLFTPTLATMRTILTPGT